MEKKMENEMETREYMSSGLNLYVKGQYKGTVMTFQNMAKTVKTDRGQPYFGTLDLWIVLLDVQQT